MSNVQTAMQAYGRTDRLATSPTDVFLTLNAELISQLSAAKTAHGQNRLDQMCRHNEKSMRIMLAIIGAFDPKANHPGAAELCVFYKSAFGAVARILSKPYPEKEFCLLIDRLQNLVKALRLSRR